jgi:hypothetical protein
MSWRVLVEINMDRLTEMQRAGEIGQGLARELQAFVTGSPRSDSGGVRKIVAYHHGRRGTVTIGDGRVDSVTTVHI